jgi:hypothetical protein
MGLDMHSAAEILPEFQHLRIGDVLPVGPNGPGLRLEAGPSVTTSPSW